VENPKKRSLVKNLFRSNPKRKSVEASGSSQPRKFHLIRGSYVENLMDGQAREEVDGKGPIVETVFWI
jgi:hypothetical protein